MSKIYTAKGWVNWDYIMDQASSFISVVGARGVGKTYGIFKKLVEEKKEKVWLVGDGANLCLKKFGEEFVKIAPPQLVLGHASGTGIAAKRLFEEEKTVSAAELVPNYLRLAQAEREKLQKEGKL